jgi:hypothetical protein
MRVTGDCLREARAFVFPADFFIGLVDFFAALFRLAAGLDALLDAAFDALFALLLPRDAARFDAVDNLRRAFPPDDFDADAMIKFLEEGTLQHCARFARNVEPDERQKCHAPIGRSRTNSRRRVGARFPLQNHRLVAECNHPVAAIPAGRVSSASATRRSRRPSFSTSSRPEQSRHAYGQRGPYSNSDRRRFRDGPVDSAPS